MGKLYDEIRKDNAPGKSRSRIREILETLSKEDQRDFLKALNDHSIPASNISKTMERRGYKLGINIITRYRRGELISDFNEFV